MANQGKSSRGLPTRGSMCPQVTNYSTDGCCFYRGNVTTQNVTKSRTLFIHGKW